MKTIFLAAVLGAFALAWAEPKVSTNYAESIRAWQKHRDDGLRAPDGWLTLAGLFWLQPGHQQTIGSADGEDFVLPQPAPPHLGKLLLGDGRITFTNLAGAGVTVDGKPIDGPVTLSFDNEKPTVVHAGPISFLAIQRGDRFALRAKDSDSSVLKNFAGMKFFPINAELHFPDAKLLPDPTKIPILNVLGQTDLEDSPGVVEFVYRGTTYHLRPIFEDKTLYFLFKDPTNRTQTYQAGRMLNTPLPVDGKVDLDFNRSYNPPCTFTPYATCPLPPKENVLPIPVIAGEMRYGKGHPEA
jgi:uncharacterized protein (DUF1684 family)